MGELRDADRAASESTDTEPRWKLEEESHDVYDVLGIGIGPFNLGLAALLDGVDESIDAVFLDQKPEFSWHDGMLIEGTTLEVPFLADLVTLADPTNPHSYLNFARETDRIYELYFLEQFQTPRLEYDEYLRWVANRLDECQFDRRVTAVESTDGYFTVTARDPQTDEQYRYHAADIVLGVGSRPYVPDELAGHPSDVFHTAEYCDRRTRCLDADRISVVGSGQSAAEVFLDLLDRQTDAEYRLDWVTRSDGFFPMEYSKLGLQHFTPEYVQYFTALPQAVKDEVLSGQDLLYKGIDPDTSAAIYELLYQRSIGDRSPDVGMIAMTAVRNIEAVDEPTGRSYRLECNQWQTDERFSFESDVVVLGTGYHRPLPDFHSPIESAIQWDEQARYRITDDYRVMTDDTVDGRLFVQNAELHTHGVGAPDLGLGCYRNAVIIEQLCDGQPYPIDRDTVFQDFSVEEFLAGREHSERVATSEVN